MVTFPFCKINLGLRILSRRADGYHDIETCFYPVLWTDILEIIPARTFKFSSSGIPIPGEEEENSCIKIYRMLEQDYKISPVNIHLHKAVPAGAGLGGGSSDGAFALKMLNDIFRLNIERDKLFSYATRLGSDCSFFLQEQAAIGTGKGEILTPSSVILKGKYLVIIKPSLHMSTAEAYAGVTPHAQETGLASVLARPVSEWRTLVVNDFELSVSEKYPVISQLKDRLYSMGAIYSSMSGSGSSVFGLFESEPAIPHELSAMEVFTCTL